MRRSLVIAGTICLALSLAACSVSVTGGIVGGALTVLVGLGLLVFGGATQSGCSSIIGPCLSPVPPRDAEAPKKKADAGAKKAQPDAGVRDAAVAPPSVAPDTKPDPEPSMQVCLSEMPLHPCLSKAPIQPCLEMVPPQGMLDGPSPAPLDRYAIKAKLIAQGALPQDVLDRLS